jgi:cob(I)alamin adenosyltransferase
MKIYTRGGDRGETGLLSGGRVQKDDPRVQTYGTLDELQSHLGLARSLTDEETVGSVLYEIQRDIFVAGSELASAPEALSRLRRRLGTREVSRLEDIIDAFTGRYGLPEGFVVPGRSPDSAALHVARAVCRRCERLIVLLHRQTRAYPELIVYFNRLSDLLFVLAWSLEVRAVIRQVVKEISSGRQESKP